VEVFLTKRPDGTLAPNTEDDVWQLGKIKVGQPVRVTLKRVRNYEFHRKYFALMKFAYDHWEQPHNEVAVKDFDRFRKDIIILAGYYEQTLRLDGTTRVEAKSIAFHNMDEDEFEKLYNASVEVIRRYIFNDIDPDEMGYMLDELESFA